MNEGPRRPRGGGEKEEEGDVGVVSHRLKPPPTPHPASPHMQPAVRRGGEERNHRDCPHSGPIHGGTAQGIAGPSAGDEGSAEDAGSERGGTANVVRTTSRRSERRFASLPVSLLGCTVRSLRPKGARIVATGFNPWRRELAPLPLVLFSGALWAHGSGCRVAESPRPPKGRRREGGRRGCGNRFPPVETGGNDPCAEAARRKPPCAHGRDGQ